MGRMSRGMSTKSCSRGLVHRAHHLSSKQRLSHVFDDGFELTIPTQHREGVRSIEKATKLRSHEATKPRKSFRAKWAATSRRRLLPHVHQISRHTLPQDELSCGIEVEDVYQLGCDT